MEINKKINNVDVLVKTESSAKNDAKLLDLLREWDLDELYDLLLSNGVTYCRLQYLSKDDIHEMIKSVGLRAEFREKLFTWKHENYSGTPQRLTSSIAKLSKWKESNSMKLSTSTPLATVKSEHNTSSSSSSLKRKRPHSLTHPNSNNKKYIQKKSDESIFTDTSYPNVINLDKKIKKRQSKSFSKKSNKTNGFNKSNDDSDIALDFDKKLLSSFKAQMKNFCKTDTDEAKKYWVDSYPLRRKEIDENDSKIYNIFDEWPFLLSNNASDYINLDFEQQYPDKLNNMLVSWEKFIDKIMTYYEDNKIKDKQSLQLLDLTKLENISTDSKHYILAILLNSILRPTIRIPLRSSTKGPRTYYHPTIKDAENTFAVYVKDINELENVRKEKLKKSQKINSTVQPFILVVGVENTHLSDFYVIIDNVPLKCISFVHALDTCFKSFFVLNLKYPIESELAWLFLQKYFFNITTPTDQKSTNLTLLLSVLED